MDKDRMRIIKNGAVVFGALVTGALAIRHHDATTGPEPLPIVRENPELQQLRAQATIHEIETSAMDFYVTADYEQMWLSFGKIKAVKSDANGVPVFLASMRTAEAEESRDGIFAGNGKKLYETKSGDDEIVGFEPNMGFVAVLSTTEDPGDSSQPKLQRLKIYNYLDQKAYELTIPEGAYSLGRVFFDPTTQKMALSLELSVPDQTFSTVVNMLYDYSGHGTGAGEMKFHAFLGFEKVIKGLNNGVFFSDPVSFPRTYQDSDLSEYQNSERSLDNFSAIAGQASLVLGPAEARVVTPDLTEISFWAGYEATSEYIFGNVTVRDRDGNASVGFVVYNIATGTWAKLKQSAILIDPNTGQEQPMQMPLIDTRIEQSSTFQIFGDSLIIVTQGDRVFSIGIASVLNPELRDEKQLYLGGELTADILSPVIPEYPEDTQQY